MAINAFYLVLRAAYWQEAIRGWQVVGTLVLWILQYIAYQGVLDSSETHSNKDKLAGGIYLDLLGLTLVVQFGTALWTSKVYWLLCIVPPYGLWTLYTTFKGSMPGAGMDATNMNDAAPSQEESKEKAYRRQKRAERRRQKWS